jgi:L-2-hydroxyglutarate oxidase
MADYAYDLAVVGAGIIGLAVGMRLTQEFPSLKVTVIEKEQEVALHQTGHNSGVIHAGIYYAPGSQKANFCSTGGKLLREFCDRTGVQYDMCGKLIIAVREEEVPRLDDLFYRGTENGAEGLRMVDADEIGEIEPFSAGVKGIFSPNTGIIDYSEVSRMYAEQFGEQGGDLLTKAELLSADRRDGLIYLNTTAGIITAKNVINCAGLHADYVAKMMGVDTGVRIVPFRGEYFSIVPEKVHMVKGLIYPVPDPKLPFLGVHFTKRVDGSVEAGPNAVLAFAKEGYSKTSVSAQDLLNTFAYPGFWKMSAKFWKIGLKEQYRSLAKGAFINSLKTLIPEIEESDLGSPGAGVRAQAVDRNGNLLQDFSISETDNAIHVMSAPSPGATSSLTISEYIVDLAKISYGLKSVA